MQTTRATVCVETPKVPQPAKILDFTITVEGMSELLPENRRCKSSFNVTIHHREDVTVAVRQMRERFEEMLSGVLKQLVYDSLDNQS